MAFDINELEKRVKETEAVKPEVEQEEGTGLLNAPLIESIGGAVSRIGDAVSGLVNVSPEERERLYEEALDEDDVTGVNPEAFEESPGVDEELAERNEVGRQGFVRAVDEMADDPKGMDTVREFRSSEFFQRVFLTPEEKLAKARVIARETGLTTDAILQDETSYKNAVQVYDYVNQVKAAVGPGRVFSMEAVFKQFPELEGIADMDDDQIALALHDIGRIREMQGIFKENRSLVDQYLSYARKGWEFGNLTRQENRAWGRVAESKDGRQGLGSALAASREVQEKAMRAPNMFDDPLKAVIFGVSTSAPEMLYDMMDGGGIGAVVGGVAGLAAGTLAVGVAGTVGLPVTAGATAVIGSMTAFGASEGFWAGNFNAMTKGFEGETYKKLYENRNLKSRNRLDNHSFTHEEMQETAREAGPLKALWEVADQRLFKGMVTPSKKLFEKDLLEGVKELAEEHAAKRVLGDAAAKAGKKAAEKVGKEGGEAAAKRAAAEASRNVIADSYINRFVSNEVPMMLKAPLGSMVGEASDEFLQSATDDLLESRLKVRTGRGGAALTYKEILMNAANAGLQAAPGGFGFGFFGVPYHAVSATTGLGINIQKEIDFQERYTEDAKRTILGANLLAGIKRLVGNSKLNEADAELMGKIIRNQAEGSGCEMVYIDTASVLDKEGGMEQLRKIAKAAGIDDAALQTAVEQGNLTVPIECYAQSAADNSVLNSVSFDENAPSITEMIKNAEYYAGIQAEMAEQAKQDVEKVRGIIVNQYFPDDKDAGTMAVIAMYDNPQNPAAGLREMENQIHEAKRSLTRAAMERLRQGIVDDGRQLETANARWVQDFMADKKRLPNDAELEAFAEKMTTRETGAPIVDGWAMDEAAYNGAEEVRNQLTELNNELEIIKRTKEKLSDMTSSEIKNIIGLSDEAVSVYRTLRGTLTNMPVATQRAARLNAIIFARHADRFAKLYSEKSGRRFTAIDYYNRVRVQYEGEQQPGAMSQMAGVNAKNAPLDKLEQARAMQKEGKSAKEIWRETGWMQGDDAKWRFEIPDDDELMDINKLYQEKKMRLEDFYNNPKLFEAYPFLKDITIEVKRMPKGVKGSWNKEANLISIRKGVVGYDIRNDGLNTQLAIIHEIQHAIQGREGFAVGGNPETVRQMLQDELARLKEFNINLTEDEKTYLSVKNSLFEYMLGNKKMTEQQLELNQSMLEEYTSKISEERREEIELNRSRKETIEKLLAENISDEELYNRLAGELEAQETSARAAFGLQWMLPNIHGEGAIVVFGGREYAVNPSMAVNVPVNENTEYPVLDLSKFADEIGETADNDDAREKIIAYITDKLVGTNTSVLSKDLTLNYSFDYGDEGNIHHVVYANSTKGNSSKSKNTRKLLGKTLSNFKDILSKSILVEIKLNPENKTGKFADKKHQANRLASIRAVLPVQFPGGKVMTMVITADTSKEILDKHAIDVSLYEISIKRTGPRVTTTQPGPVMLNITDILWDVKDLTPGKAEYYVDHETGKLRYADKMFFEDKFEAYNQSNANDLAVNRRKTNQFAPGTETHEIGLDFGSYVYGKNIFGEYVFEDDQGGVVPQQSNKYFVLSKIVDLNFDNEKIKEELAKLDEEVTNKSDEELAAAGWDSKKIKTERKKINLLRKTLLNGGATIDGYTTNINEAPMFTPINENLSAEENLQKDIAQFVYKVDNWENINRNKPVEIMHCPLVFKIAGLQNNDVVMDYSRFKHILEGHQEGMDANVLKKIPLALTDPLFIAQSKGSIIVVLDIPDNRGLTVSSFFLKNSKAHDGKVVTKLKSAYPKEAVDEKGIKIKPAQTAYQWYIDEFLNNPDKMIYINRKKTTQWLVTGGINISQSSNGISSLSIDSIPNEEDLSKEKEKNKAYFQGIKGSTTKLADGKRLIQLFESADESTFLHEMGHLFLMDLEELALVDERSAAELQAVQEWAEWKQGDWKKYRGTPWSKEFADREQAIIDAEMHGDFAEVEKQKRIWKHERFARAFEMYLRDGKAPSKGLRAVFRSFAKFLRQVYSAFVSDGARASAAVEHIMGRMIATDEEIEAMAMDEQFRDIEKAGGEKLLNETEKETYERWLNEAKEEAREKLQKEVLKDLTKKQQQEYEARLAQVQQEARTELEQEPVYLARAIIASMGGDIKGALNVFPSISEFEKADAAAPDIEQAVKDKVDAWRDQQEARDLQAKIDDEKVRQAMESTEGHQRAKALETAAMARKLDLKRKINTRAEQAITGIQDAIDSLPEHADLQLDAKSDPVQKLTAKINELRFSTRWNARDFAEIEKMVKAATKEELEKQLNAFKENMKKQKLDVKAMEEANKGRMKLFQELARDSIAKQQIFNAVNVNEHRRAQRQYERNAQKWIKSGRIDMAVQQQQAAAMSAAMANEAAKAKETVDRLVAGINRQLNAKTIKLPAKERYWHRMLAWQLRIGEYKEPEKPVLKNGQQIGALRDLIEGYQTRLDLAEDYDVDAITDIIERNKQTGFKGMTVDEFRKVADLMKIIYKCGKDEFNMKTIAGKTIDEAVNDIINEASLADRMSIQRRRIEDNTGGLGWNDWAAKIPVIGEKTAKLGQGYLSIGLKPEKIIELLGDKAHQYIYGTLDRAANDEAEMMAKAIRDVQGLLAAYSHSDRQNWKRMDYEFTLPTEDGGVETVRCSKENILCMALNMGTAINRQRLTGGFFGLEKGETEEQRQAATAGHTNTLLNFCNENMTKKDWELVQSIWDYLHTYWADTCRVEEELNGQHLKAQEPLAFTVFTADGEQVKLRGGYYPIKYNPDKDEKAGQRAADDMAKQMGGSQKVLGTGRSHVKSRSEADVFHELELKFDVIPAHIQQVIHNITHRLAARDVYRLINNSTLSEYISGHMGAPYHDLLSNWALDCWRQVPEKDSAANVIERSFAALRSNSTFAIMAYRVWPALENLSNIGPVADRLGYVNALSGIFEFYGHMKDFRKLMDKSVLMRNRINNMDRDIRSQQGLFSADNNVMEQLREHGYDMMTYSDLMFSAPLWCRAYKDNYMQCYQETVRDNMDNKDKLQNAQEHLDRLRGALIDAKKDVQDWHEEKSNRARAGQVGWQPGSSRFAVMGGAEFSTMLPELNDKIDKLREMIWHAEAEYGHVAELKVLSGAELVKEAERRAVEKADAAVRDAFGSGRTVDLAAVSRSRSELAKSLTTFYSFFNTQFNALYFKYIHGKYGMSENFSTWENMRQWAPFAKGVMNRIIITSLIGSLLKMATKTDGDSDRDRWRKVKGEDGKTRKEEVPWIERFLKVFAKNSLSMTTGAFYGVRDVANLALNLAFDGTDFGRGLNVTSTPLRSMEEGFRTIKLIVAKSRRDAEIAEKQEADAEKYSKMNRKQRAKWDEEQKYKKPIKRITYADIFRSGANAMTGLSAASTGISSTIIDSITGTMQYLTDTDNRYDATWRNIIWSAIFDKKPVERDVPQKPEPTKKKKQRKKKK